MNTRARAELEVARGPDHRAQFDAQGNRVAVEWESPGVLQPPASA